MAPKPQPCYRVVPDALCAGRVNLIVEHVTPADAEELIVVLCRRNRNAVEGNVASVSRVALDVVKRALHRLSKQRKPRCRTTTIPWEPVNSEGNEQALHDGLVYRLRKDDINGWQLSIRYDNNHGDHDAPPFRATMQWDPNTAGWQWFQNKAAALECAQHVATERRTELLNGEGALDPRAA